MEGRLRNEVHKSLNLCLIDNAVFLCERLFADQPNEENAFLLAKCYQRNRQEYRAYNVLKGGGPYKILSNECRLLLAQCCVKLGYLDEAEEVLLKKYRRPGEGPLGAVENFLVGKIHRMTKRQDSAKKYFANALELDPFLWSAFEELCRLGADADTTTYLRTIAAMAGIENDMQSLQLNSPGEPANSTPLINASNQLSEPQQGRERPFPGFFEGGRYDCGSPRTPPSLTSPAPPGVPWDLGGEEHGIMSDNDEMQEDHGVASKSRGGKGKGRKNEPIRRSARIAAQGKGRMVPHQIASPTLVGSTSVQQSVPQRSVSDGVHRRQTAVMHSNHVNRSAHDSSAVAARAGLFASKSGRRGDGVKEAMQLITFLGEGYRLLCISQCKEAIHAFASRLPKNQYFTGWVLCQVAKAHVESVDYHSAEKCFEDARRVDPHRLEDMDVFSTVLWQLGDDVRLSHLASAALDLDRLAPQTWCIVGNLHSRQREHETAVRAFQRAMQLDAERPYSHTLCGHEFFAVEDFHKAQQCFEMALVKDPRHYNAWYGCGLVCYRQEKYENAERHFRRAIQINNSSSVLKCQLGMTLAKLNRNDDALVQLQQAINADRKNIISWIEKARVLQSMSKSQEALEVLKGALVIEHRDPCLHYHAGCVLKKLGNKDDAIKHFCQALDLKPSAADQNAIRTAIEKINVVDDSQDTEL